MIQKVSHVTVWVLSQDEAKKFYCELLGFEVKVDMRMEGGFRWLTVSPPGQPDLQIVLMEPKEGPMCNAQTAATIRELVRQGAFSIGVFSTTDCHATYEALKARGVEFMRPPTEQFYGIETVGRDNSGNWFSLTQPKQWQG
jgi:predicted enzyme related to lactoylglutathione lyase